MPSDEPSRPYNWRPKSLAKLELFNILWTYFIYIFRLEKERDNMLFSKCLLKIVPDRKLISVEAF